MRRRLLASACWTAMVLASACRTAQMSPLSNRPAALVMRPAADAAPTASASLVTTTTPPASEELPSVRGVPLRALILGPSYVWTDARYDVDNFTHALDQAGVPYDVQPPSTSWEHLIPQMDRYTLLVVPGYLEGGTLPEELSEAFTSFATRGGVVILMKPLGVSDDLEPLQLAGIKSSTRHRAASSLRIDGATAPALAAIDTPEEKELLEPQDVWTYEPESKAKTAVLAHAYQGARSLGAVATRRPLGRGAIYAWGHDLATFASGHCYVNCFEPSGDVLRLFLRDAFRESAGGHVVLKHPMPGPADSTLLLTHDIDAPDAYRPGPWGEPGALQMAAMEKRHGVRATYNLTTDYFAGYFRPEVARSLCDLDMCPLGNHSVRHLKNFDKLPRGDCKETRANYDGAEHPTVCGEVLVPNEILSALAGQPPQVWRSGFLRMNPDLYDVLLEHGIRTASDVCVGDLRFNLPIDGAHTGMLQDVFRHRPIYEFPIACEDGIGTGQFKRKELQATNLEQFETVWTGALLGNAANQSFTVVLVHPSCGMDMPPENLALKVRAVERLIETAQAHGIPNDTLEHFGAFWRARAQVALSDEYAAGAYRGTLKTGTLPVTDLTLEFGEPVRAFECKSCGKAEINGSRVTIRSTLAPNTVTPFSARP